MTIAILLSNDAKTYTQMAKAVPIADKENVAVFK